MRLPANATIAEDKLLRYLLLPQVRGDKSAFLAQAGYVRENTSLLLHDLHTQIVPIDAVQLESTMFGQYYEICCTLIGPNGLKRAVRTILDD